MATIAVLGTLDTKGHEHAFVADWIRQAGHQAMLIDVGTQKPPQINPSYTRESVFSLAHEDSSILSSLKDRGTAVTKMGQVAAKALRALVEQKRIQGVISLGGGGGTSIAATAMQALPLGFPKVIVSTLASGNTSQYIGSKDIVLFPSIVDISGINRISRPIFTRAAGAICGMVESYVGFQAVDEQPAIVASMFGNTTGCVDRAKVMFKNSGFETLVFHCTGIGGQTMESIIDSGLVQGVFDITTTELADEVVGGVLSAGPDRLNATGRAKLPAVIAPGCVDMVNFQGKDTIPEKFKDRLFYEHNPQVTLMRTNVEEATKIGALIAQKVNAYTAPVTIFFPTRGISALSGPSQPFHDPEADQALFAAIKANIRKDIPCKELKANINDAPVADAMARELITHINTWKAKQQK